MSPPTPTKRQGVTDDGSPGRQHAEKKPKVGIKLIEQEARDALVKRGTPINREDIGMIQNKKAQTQSDSFKNKWALDRNALLTQDELKKALSRAAKRGAEIGTEAAIKSFIAERYAQHPENATKKLNAFLEACKRVEELKVERDGKTYAMSLLDTIRPVMDANLKIMLRKEIKNATAKATKNIYHENLPKQAQPEFGTAFIEMMKKNGGNDEVTAQVMYEFALQQKANKVNPQSLPKLPKKADDKTKVNKTSLNGTNGASGATRSK